MAAQKPSFKRIRFSVPLADVSVLEWIESQGSLSHSIRALIKAYIKEHGMTDPTCDLVTEPTARVGRPTKLEAQQKAAYAPVHEEPAPEPVTEPVTEWTPSVQAESKPVIPPQTRPKRAMTFPMVDGTETGLQGATVGGEQTQASPGEPLMDMTLFMAGGNR